MATSVATPAPVTPPAATLRPLYFLRFGFAAVWAALLLASGDGLGPLSRTLLVLYPVFDVACAIVDLRSTRASRGPARALYANIALSTLTTAGLLAAVFSGTPAVLRVWAAWAVTAGLAQLLVALQRRTLPGQWPMIASGAISTLAGASFAAQSTKTSPSLHPLAGYAFLGGVFFLTSALRLRRTPGN
ncbi:hypothetical protein [Actinacidiphila bryophytorum]|uniref:Integral membrane protein n=2 Tax=Actinacidiphila bryophytorum TaxID=1436133 RepID=A0A9W4MEF7_9ACTN|nr:hypothetical protein [Actinacidiphila bryophytorum]MBM9435844.1 hypothetical protein [Actinacidiphila bryophytorum]CAG7649933.1 Integral membrane protein [Actinacidiphila bryophytorum]